MMSGLRLRAHNAWWSLKHEGARALALRAGRELRLEFRGLVSRVGLRTADITDVPKMRFFARPVFQVTAADVERSRRVARRSTPPRTATWFVPRFDHAAFGGISTIFRFISGFTDRGLHSTVVIHDSPHQTDHRIRAPIVDAFPNLSRLPIRFFDPVKEEVNELPPSDIAVSAMWTSAYVLLRFNQTGRKFYFIQDYEPLFYPAGSTYALAESTYRFGFEGIVNTPGLLAHLQHQYALDGTSFEPAVDARYYHPPPTPRSGASPRIFFYMRPPNPRNAFELSVLAIAELLRRYGNGIDIVTAGGRWHPARFGLQDRVTDLGLLANQEEVGDLYRTCDIGVVYMMSKHPSYQPFEFMASGMATVTNRNEANLWFLKDGENCLLTEPSPAAVGETVGRLVEDPKLRERISRGGLASVHTDWGRQIDSVWRYVSS